MLRIAVRSVHPEHLDLLRNWLSEVGGPRRDEALTTLADEGCSHEQALLVNGPDGPFVVYVMEVTDVEEARRAAATSEHPIDAEHKRVMGLATGPDLPTEILLDLHP